MTGLRDYQIKMIAAALSEPSMGLIGGGRNLGKTFAATQAEIDRAIGNRLDVAEMERRIVHSFTSQPEPRRHTDNGEANRLAKRRAANKAARKARRK